MRQKQILFAQCSHLDTGDKVMTQFTEEYVLYV